MAKHVKYWSCTIKAKNVARHMRKCANKPNGMDALIKSLSADELNRVLAALNKA